MDNMESRGSKKAEGVRDADYEQLVSIWGRVLDRLNSEGDASYMREFIKQGLLDAVNCLVGYHIVLVADYWYNKHILLEEDLGEIIHAVRAANGGRLCINGCTAEELAWEEQHTPY